MTAYALISGTIFRAPERKTSRAGKPFVTLTIKTRDGDEAVFWRVVTFSQSAGEELMTMREGDSVALQGAMRAELYTPDNGAPRVSLSLVADSVLPVKPRARRKDHDDDRDADRRDRHEPAPPAGRPSDWRAREGRKRSLNEQAANGGGRFAPASYGRVDAALDDDIPF